MGHREVEIGRVDEAQALGLGVAWGQLEAAKSQFAKVWAACGLGEFNNSATYRIDGGVVTMTMDGSGRADV